ncbi:DinB family protein [Desertihabitans aurantiacus]|uniref:DinB family protein n=1 Tax=Desertihabitans aurantiacus TaxID=2282477 RepID=UPI000DF7C648|nr:DinB family protein [Desertihabitans aurantiacus]
MSEQQRRTHPDMWLDPADDPRTPSDPARGEKEVVLGYLDHYRTTLELKCQGLDPEQLARRSVPPSTLSLLGLVRHLADVEHSWSRRVLLGRSDLPRLFRTSEDRDADFNGAVPDKQVVAEAWEHWHREVAHAREVEATLDLDAMVVAHDGEQTEVRDVLVHLVEEYARHLGHADLLREAIDGRTGQ